MSTLAQQDAWRPEAPARLVVSDPPTPFPLGTVILGIIGGLLGACVLLVLILRGREWLYRAHAGACASRRAAAALKISRGESALARKLAKAGGSSTSAVLVSGEVLRVCAQTLCDRGISSSERARIAAMCDRFGVKPPEAKSEAPAKPSPAPVSTKGAASKKTTGAKGGIPQTKRRAG